MTTKQILSNVRSKTIFFFIILLGISLLICLGISLYEYSIYKFVPKFSPGSSNIAKNLHGLYHQHYFVNFIKFRTFIIFFDNLFFFSLVFFTLCYSLIINKTHLLTTDNKKILFSNIVTTGLFILIGLTVIFYLANDLLLPVLRNRVEGIKNNTIRSIIILDKANQAYYQESYSEANDYYTDYLNYVGNDDLVENRIHEVQNKINTQTFEQNKKKKVSPQNQIDLLIANNIKDYSKLADIYFEQKDYYTAWYYYQYIAESPAFENNVFKRNEAKNKINQIRKILAYENSIQSETDKLNIAQLNARLDTRNDENRKIYILKKQADQFKNNAQYQKAYFIYQDILSINPNLRDVISENESTYKELTKIGIDIQEIENARIYPGKKNLVFILKRNTLFYIEYTIKTPDKFYLYNIKIYNLDNYYNILSTISARYGESKGSNVISLYAYSKTDRTIEYNPLITYANVKTALYPDTLLSLPTDMNIIYNFSYDYNNAIELSLKKLVNLQNFTQVRGEQQFSIGLNSNFIKTAITDKVSRIFIFFFMNLFIIGLAWRLKSSYLANIPATHLILIGGIPFFLFIFQKLVYIMTSYFYSTLSYSFTMMFMLVICFSINIVLMIISIIYIASTP